MQDVAGANATKDVINEENDHVKEIVEMCIPIMKYIKENFNSHTKICITSLDINIREDVYFAPLY